MLNVEMSRNVPRRDLSTGLFVKKQEKRERKNGPSVVGQVLWQYDAYIFVNYSYGKERKIHKLEKAAYLERNRIING